MIAGSIGAHLRHAGMAVECVEDGDRALRKARFERPDVVVLDLMLPGPGRLAGAARAPRRRHRVPGHRRERPGLGAGQGAGAEDGRRRLRRQAVRDERARRPASRRCSAAAGSRPRLAGPRSSRCPGSRSTPTCTASSSTEPTPGSRRSSSGCSRCSPPRAGRVLTRDQLRQRVWGVPQRKRDRSVDVCVRKLRSKIDLQSRTHVYIHTHPGVGYRFDPVPR